MAAPFPDVVLASLDAMAVTVQEHDLLEAARRGDEGAYRELVERHRGELHAHCYRMTASVHDAEDALQDALLRIWRAIGRFEGRSSLRSWLYKVATNSCLDLIERRKKRVLPMDFGPAADASQPAGDPVTESVWVEPYPDLAFGVEDGPATPDARYEQRESVELAFIAAVQHLPATQRATLIMRDVLGFSAQETAESLETSVASANSALQRARRTVEERLPEQSQQATLRALGDEELTVLVEDYMDAMQRGDVDRVVSMLAEDAAWSMPPLASWYRGDQLPTFLRVGPLSGEWRWRHRRAQVNGQLTSAAYSWVEEEGAFLPFALDVLTLEGRRIREVTAFITRAFEGDAREYYARWPEKALDRGARGAIFESFGLPARLTD
jgi:RNA polymerase sigma-70 factor (ECF subfamily)